MPSLNWFLQNLFNLKNQHIFLFFVIFSISSGPIEGIPLNINQWVSILWLVYQIFFLRDRKNINYYLMIIIFIYLSVLIHNEYFSMEMVKKIIGVGVLSITSYKYVFHYRNRLEDIFSMFLYMSIIIAFIAIIQQIGWLFKIPWLYDFGYLGMQFFLLILILFIIIPPVPFYVPLTSKLNNFISSLKTSRFNDKYLFRVRFLIPLGILYLLILSFSKINKSNLDKIFLIDFNIFDLGLFIGFSFLLIFSLIRTHADESFQTRIVLVILIQSFLLFFLEGSNFSNESFYLRNIILIIMILITGVNYFQNSKHLGFEFWSVIDLLILILFIALVILKINGVQLGLFSILEILFFYYSLSLYAQRRHPRLKI